MVYADEYLDRQRTALNEVLNELLKERGTSFQEAAHYTVLPEGKRYRGIVSLEVYGAFSGDQENFLKSAVGIECIHHATLIFDDLPCMDNSPLRKGKPTVHRQFDEATAILAALYLKNLGEHLIYENAREHGISDDEFRSVLSLMNETTVNLLKGQELDLKNDKSDEELFSAMQKKNDLFYLACVLPIYVLNRTSEEREIMKSVGTDLAVAYQLFDDLRDVEGDLSVIGKEQHQDNDTFVYRRGVEWVKDQLDMYKEHIINKIRILSLPHQGLEFILKTLLTKPS